MNLIVAYPFHVTIAIAIAPSRSIEREINATMRTATNTNQQSPKRTRFTPEETAADKSTTPQPPKALAESFIRLHIASLHPEIKTIVEKLGKEHLILLSKTDHKVDQSQRLINDKEFIPSSARVNVDLKVTKLVAESQEYKALEEETNDIIKQFQLDLKKQIIKANTLECNAAKLKLQQHLAKAIRLITQSCMIAAQDVTNVDTKVYTLMSNFSDNLTTHVPMQLNEFVTLYKEIHGLDDTFPPRLASNPAGRVIQTATMTITTDTYDMDDFDDSLVLPRALPNVNPTAIVPNDIIKIKDIIEGVFVSSWTKYKAQQHSNKVTIQLKKLSMGYFVERETTESVAVIDKEPAADQQELKSLIRSETREDNKDLRKTLELVQKELASLKNAKNDSKRGRGGASGKTKSQPPTKKKNSSSSKKQQPKKEGKADKRNKESGNEKKNSKPPNGKPPSDKKCSSSKDKKRSSSKTSKSKQR